VTDSGKNASCESERPRTRVINSINFTLSALLAPVRAQVLHCVSEAAEQRELMHYQIAFSPMLGCICVAIVLAVLLGRNGDRHNGSFKTVKELPGTRAGKAATSVGFDRCQVRPEGVFMNRV
jgi:hypothetical protein